MEKKLRRGGPKDPLDRIGLKIQESYSDTLYIPADFRPSIHNSIQCTISRARIFNSDLLHIANHVPLPDQECYLESFYTPTSRPPYIAQ